MPTFIVDESVLRRLSPLARRELLQVIAADMEELRADYADRDWDPEGSLSYPLSVEEATHLIHGMPEAACKALRVFAEHYDGKKGTATFQQLLEATGHTKWENVTKQFAWILLRLRSIVGNPDAWIVTWRNRDWKWDESKQTYTRGKYLINGQAIMSLREAFGIH